MGALSGHLDGYCAVEASLEDATRVLQGFLQRFGPVERLDGSGFSSVIEQLLPLASFPSRYLLLPRSGWTVILSNTNSPAAVDVQTVLSRRLHARCVYGSWSERGRMLTVVDRGETLRAVACYREAGWVFHQEGTPEPFEDLARYERHRKSERLPPGPGSGVPDATHRRAGSAELASTLLRSIHQASALNGRAPSPDRRA